MKRALALVLLVLLVVAVAVPALAGGPHNKATGTVTWTGGGSGQFPGLMSSFDAHDGAPGVPSDRGSYYFYRPAYALTLEGWWEAELTCVNVSGNEAWASGPVVDADGLFENEVGRYYVYWMKDNSTPGADGPDQLGILGPYDPVAACDRVEQGNTRGAGFVTGGNLKIHYWAP